MNTSFHIIALGTCIGVVVWYVFAVVKEVLARLDEKDQHWDE